MLKRIVATFSSLLIMGQAFAAAPDRSATLTINVGGSIWALPYWTIGGTQGTSATYTFAVYTGSSGNSDLTSSTNTLQLKLDAAAPVTSTVALVNPKGCTIGGADGTKVSDGNVRFVTADGNEQTSGNLDRTLFTQANQTTSIRFKTVPSAASGSVACGTPGSLTYTY